MSFTVSVRRDLTLIAAGRGLSMLGDEVAVIALALWASHRGHGTLAVAALVIASVLPQLLAAPWAGLIVDRHAARRLIATFSLLQAAVCVALVPVIGADSLAGAVALVMVLNLGQTVVSPAWQALVPVIVAPEQLNRALSVVQGSTAGAMLLGPAVGGLLVGAFDTSVALVVDAVTFVLLAAFALALRHDRRPERPDVREKGEMSAGIRLFVGDRLLRSVLVLVTALVLCAGAINVAEIFLITQTLGAGPAAYGVVGALFAAGLMIGAVLARKGRSVTAAGRLLVVVAVSMALSMVVLGLAPNLELAALAGMALGVGNGMLNVTAQSIIVRRSPQEVLGRVYAALQGVVGAAMLLAVGAGGLLLGVLSDRTLIVGCGALAVVVLLTVSRPLLSTPETDTADSQPLPV